MPSMWQQNAEEKGGRWLGTTYSSEGNLISSVSSIILSQHLRQKSSSSISFCSNDKLRINTNSAFNTYLAFCCLFFYFLGHDKRHQNRATLFSRISLYFWDIQSIPASSSVSPSEFVWSNSFSVISLSNSIVSSQSCCSCFVKAMSFRLQFALLLGVDKNIRIVGMLQ